MHARAFNFAPGIGYQVSRNWGVGLAGDIRASKMTQPGLLNTSNELKQSRTYIGPFIRYTQPLSPMFFVYGQLNGQYLRTNDIVVSNGLKASELEGNGFAINLMPAVGVNISRSMALVGSFGNLAYESVTKNAPTGGADLTEQGFDASFGRNFTLGLQWNLGGRPHMHRRNRVEPMSETRRMDRYRDNDDDDRDDREEAPRRRTERRYRD